jgi:DNA polymerase-3 subunit delta'
MSKLIINPTSEKNILKLAKHLPQSLLLTGNDGVGLSSVAKYFAELRNVKPIITLPEKDEKIDIENGIINVDIMRRLYEDTRTKPSGDRLIVIDYADRMTNQAQNAFLKLLEEPGEGTYFILVCHSVSKLLPTILSRVEKIQIKNITRSQSEELLNQLKVTDKTKRSQILFMAEGLPATITNLANDNKLFEKNSQIVCDARELIRGNQYQKLLIIQKYKDNRTGALDLLINMTKILKLSLNSNPQPEAINRLDVVLSAYDQIESNGNIRLVLASTVI